MTQSDHDPNEQRPEQSPKQRRGFALLKPEVMREIASQGGKTAHSNGTANKWTSDTARMAGKTGGIKTAQDREYMREIGRKGGAAKKGYRKRKASPPCEPGKEPADTSARCSTDSSAPLHRETGWHHSEVGTATDTD